MTEQTISSGALPGILIVEDSPVEAEMLRRILVRANYRVTVTRNGEEGLQALREHPCALVISDIQMPLMNGYEMCRAIKLDEKLWSIPVILVTMLSEPKDIIKALDVGADSYITKPYVEAILLGRISLLLAEPLPRKLAEERRKVQVEYGGEIYNIAAGGQLMANMLFSVYENSLILNHELMRIQNQFNLLNDNLDEQVRLRTAELLAERQNLERTNRALRTLSAGNVALVRASTEEELFQTVCRHIVEIGEYFFAGVFFPGAEAESNPSLVSCFGGDATRQRLVELLQRDAEYVRRCPILITQRTRQTQVCNKTNHTGECGLEKLADLGIKSLVSLPLINNDHLYGVLAVFSSNVEAFDTAELKLMEELAGDIAYGIVTLRTRAERDRSAAEMGCTPQQVEGIRFGALLHNIGTVAVPAEIINRPDKLSDLQFSLIKQHTQTGFEIVKDIPFPWPVAQMVLQHHERLDGSGYPQGLKGEQIILEARILAVADVLEAMMAYRPYRAALEKDVALNEITEGRGARFDPAVVDACLYVMKKNME